MCVPAWISVPCTCRGSWKPQELAKIPWDWRDRQLWVIMCVLGTKCKSFAGTVLNSWAEYLSRPIDCNFYGHICENAIEDRRHGMEFDCKMEWNKAEIGKISFFFSFPSSNIALISKYWEMWNSIDIHFPEGDNIHHRKIIYQWINIYIYSCISVTGFLGKMEKNIHTIIKKMTIANF